MKTKNTNILKYFFGTISGKITAIYSINILYIIIIMGTILIVYSFLNTKLERLNKLNELNNASLQLKSLMNESSAEILNIIYNKKDDLISHLFARNEDIFSVFDEFKNISEKNKFTENISFATENEPVIMEIRSNIVACINLYRDKKTNEAINYYDLRINNKLRQLSQFVSDSINSNNTDIELTKKEISKTENTIAIIISASFLLIIVINILLGTLIKNSILKPIKSLVNMLKNAKGDLTVHLDFNTNDELGEMAKYFNNFVKIINDMVTQVIISAQKLSTGVGQISSGNQNLSQRTAEQASSLEEIASTLEEAAAAINQNAENAIMANKVSSDTSIIAHEGKNIVQLAAEAINETKESSKTIETIVSVINEIAFQTNLLALNAAIEAARAGEYGRSFAVVAREVRNLAQGSKTAAKEIGDLIKGSVEKIDKGAELSTKSTDALITIVDAISKVEKLISEISTSSGEQKAGIEQINTAVSELDTMTQQNSSLAEETASASEELLNLSQDLLTMVKQFKINENTSESIHLNEYSETDRKITEVNGMKIKIATDLNNQGITSENENSLISEGYEKF